MNPIVICIQCRGSGQSGPDHGPCRLCKGRGQRPMSRWEGGGLHTRATKAHDVYHSDALASIQAGNDRSGVIVALRRAYSNLPTLFD